MRSSATGWVARFQAAVWISCPVLFGTLQAGAQPTRAERVVIEYVAPVQPAHKPFHDLLKEHQTLERVRDVLTPVRWPRSLRLELRGCDGESNAWYQDAIVTVCYEYLESIWRSADSAERPAGITRDDAFIGPLTDVFLHEASHALFDMLKIPLLGQEEDAADQVAAYHVLQLPAETKRGLILGNAWAYASELKVRRPRDLRRRRVELTRQATFADEHGTPAQRLYNLLCIAYGSDKNLFADVVEKGFLPPERAEICEDEYLQVDFAYRTLIAPHVDAGR
jgi:Putative metallopeptidase